MKTILILALCTLSLVSIPDRARACDTVRTVTCYKPSVVRTEVVTSRRERRMGYDSCGRCISFWVRVVTYRDVLSDGSTLRYARTFNA